MIKKLITFLYFKFVIEQQVECTAVQKKRINDFKFAMRNYFDGLYDNYEPVYKGSARIKDLGITKLSFSFNGNEMIVNIELERPGLLIGKAGSTIDGLKEYVNKIDSIGNVKIDITESRLWKHID